MLFFNIDKCGLMIRAFKLRAQIQNIAREMKQFR